MRTMSVIVSIIAVLLTLAGASSAAVPDGFVGTSFSVTAQIIPSCRNTTSGAPGFALITIDTTVPGNQIFPASTDLWLKCTKGYVFTVRVADSGGVFSPVPCSSSGVPNMKLTSGSTGDKIPYTLKCSNLNEAGTFTGAGLDGVNQGVGLAIEVAAADAQQASAGNDYSDTVVLSIDY